MEAAELQRLQRSVPFFRDLDLDELGYLMGVARVRIYREGQILFHEGDPGDGMYVLLRGEAKVEKRLRQGDQLVLSKLKPGDVIGEMALLDHEPRSATVKATARTSLFFLPTRVFDDLRRQRHPAAMKILKRFCVVLAQRARRLDSLLNDFFSRPERSLEFMEQRYLKYVGHPADEA